MKKRAILAVLVALVLSFALVAPVLVGASPGPGIVGLWHLDEVDTGVSPHTTPDSSGLGNTGFLYPIGSEPTLVAGKFDSALSFDGSNYVDCGNVLDVGSKLTVEAWVKDTGFSTGNVVGKYEAMDKRWHIYVNSGVDGKIYWNIGGWNYATSPTSAIGTDWHDLAMVYDGTQADNASRLKAYIDGVPISLTYTGTIPATMPAISGNVNIGRHSTCCFFQGTIDEVRIWDEALTAEDIARNYALADVAIDIKPGSYPNSINMDANGVIPVAILTTDAFDAADVDQATVELAGAAVQVRGKADKLMARLEDVDGDGDLDLVVQVVNELDLEPGDAEATLTGRTYDGLPFMGTDSIRIVPPE